MCYILLVFIYFNFCQICRYNRDTDAFLKAYPQAEEGVTALQRAIHQARLARGDRFERKSKNGTPATRRAQDI